MVFCLSAANNWYSTKVSRMRESKNRLYTPWQKKSPVSYGLEQEGLVYTVIIQSQKGSWRSIPPPRIPILILMMTSFRCFPVTKDVYGQVAAMEFSIYYHFRMIRCR